MAVIITATGCRKSWLDGKPDKSLIMPETVAQLQAIMDNDEIMNSKYGGLGDIGADDYFVSYTVWQTATNAQERNAYIWNKEIFENEPCFDWLNLYQKIFYCNVALEAIDRIDPSAADQAAWNNVKGSALFFRSYCFFELAQLFAKPYTAATASTDLGIPLKLSSDINEIPARSTLAATYERIITDLQQAKTFLPPLPKYKTRPSLPAVNALLARVYLSMGNYGKAFDAADACLQVYNTLLDYNTLNLSAARPFSLFNAEVILHTTMSAYSILQLSTKAKVDTLLYRSYDVNDLRQKAFFNYGNPVSIVFKGNYSGGISRFTGLSVNEILLIRAECLARTNNKEEAMNDLNALLVKRWKTGMFVPLTATDAEDALQKIITERRKELLFRGLRWTDLRRYAANSALAVTQTRLLNGNIYTIAPGDPRYVYPIPGEEVRLNGLVQNER